MTDQPNKQYVVCVPESFSHHPESVIRQCDICHERVWCMPFNLLMIPICWKCSVGVENPKFVLNKENLQAAIEHIIKEKK